jgi:YYY domain-containing protein
MLSRNHLQGRRADASKSNKAYLALALILIVAAGFRLYDLNWDEAHHVHPDERWIAMVAPTITWPRQMSELFDVRRSTLNPLWVPDGQGGGEVRNFAYGHLPLYLQSLAGHALAALGRSLENLAAAGGGSSWGASLGRELETYGNYGGISLVGRGLSVLFDLGTICLVYLLGRRIYGQRVGLLGAALSSVAVMHIQLSHFATFDVITTFFVVLAVYGAVRVVQSGRRAAWPAIWAGAAAGLAVASKFSAMPLVAVLILAHVLRGARREGEQGRLAPGRLLRRSWPGILLSLGVALLAFFVTSPFAILDARLYLKQIMEQGAMVRGQADWPFTRQYINTTSFVYQIVQQVRWGLGWPLGITAFAGLGWTLVRQVRRPRAEEWVVLGWVVPCFALVGSFMVKFMRYMLPLLPFLILMGAALLVQIVSWARRRIADRVQAGQTPGRGRLVGYRLLALAPIVVVGGTLLYALAFLRVYAQTHPWVQASEWIYAHVPDGSAIAREHWDDDLPLSLPEDRANPEAHGYNMSGALKLPMYEPDGYAKLAQVRDILRQADYLVLATNRLYRTIPRLPERYPVSTEFYRLLFAGQLGYVQEAEFTAYPGLLGLQIRDDAADESFTVYDHPKPIIFRKVRDLDDAEWNGLFAVALSKQPVTQPDKSHSLLSWLNRDPPGEGETTRTLLLDRPVSELPVVSDFGWNQWANGSTVGAMLTWWLIVSALGWLAWPLTFAIFRGLRDRGYLLARSVALLFVGYLVWLPASLHWLQNGLPLTYAAIAVLALASFLMLWRNADEMGAFLRRRRGLLLLGEAVFGLAFLLFVGIRILNPDLWQPWNGGEKSMDIAYLNACLRSAYLPPYDPYYSGGYLNYYYYGQFLISIVTRLAGLQASVAFNLAVPLLFALTVSNAFTIGYTLAGKVWPERKGDGEAQSVWSGVGYGLLAVACITILGNLASATQVIDRLGQVGGSTFTSQIPGLEALVRAAAGVGRILLHGAVFPGFNYWDPSRVVDFTINEFPYWSFLFADLHPHMINIPFTLLVVAMALNWVFRKPAPERDGLPARPSVPVTERGLAWASARYVWQRLDWGEVLNWVLWPVALGALSAINTWDWPAYAGFCGLALVYVWVRRRGRQGLVPALLASVALAAGSLVLYAPFFKYYTAIYVGLGWSLARTHTKLSEFMTVWGFFLFVAVTSLFVLLAVQRSRWAILRMVRLGVRHLARLPRLDELYALLVRKVRPGYRLSIWGTVLLLGGLVWFAWQGYWVLVLMVPLLVLAAVLIVQKEMPDGRRFVLALVFTAFLLLVGVEFFYLKDHLDGDQQGWWRMNTLFKFYLQVWIMLGLAVAALLPGAWRLVEKWRPGWRGTWTALFSLLVVAAALYPLLGTPARVADRFPGDRPPIGTLDGMAFMTVGTYTWPNEDSVIHLQGDYEAIRWLLANVQGTPVVAEAPIGYYREFGVRVASYTGLPTLMGMHESEQRYGSQVGERSALARELFVTPDLERTMALIHELGVGYVYIGPLERAEYPQAAGKFEQLALHQMLTVVYQNDLVTIYHVP